MKKWKLIEKVVELKFPNIRETDLLEVDQLRLRLRGATVNQLRDFLRHAARSQLTLTLRSINEGGGSVLPKGLCSMSKDQLVEWCNLHRDAETEPLLNPMKLVNGERKSKTRQELIQAIRIFANLRRPRSRPWTNDFVL